MHPGYESWVLPCSLVAFDTRAALSGPTANNCMLWDRDFEQAMGLVRFSRASVLGNGYREICEQDGTSVAERRLAATTDGHFEILRSFPVLAKHQFLTLWGSGGRWLPLRQNSALVTLLPGRNENHCCFVYRFIKTVWQAVRMHTLKSRDWIVFSPLISISAAWHRRVVTASGWLRQVISVKS